MSYSGCINLNSFEVFIFILVGVVIIKEACVNGCCLGCGERGVLFIVGLEYKLGLLL